MIHSFSVKDKDFKIRLFSKGALDKFHWVWWHIGKWLFCIETDMPHFPYLYIPTNFCGCYYTGTYTIKELKECYNVNLMWYFYNSDIWFFSKDRCRYAMKTLPKDRYFNGEIRED